MGWQREQERGAIAVLAAIVLIAIGGFLALSLNVGHKMNAKAQLQAAMDAAALSGALSLDGQTMGADAAHVVAHDYAVQHGIDTDPVRVDMNLGNGAGGDIETGFWDLRASPPVFHGEGTNPFIGDANIILSKTNTPQFMTAIAVRGGLDDTADHNSRLDVYFAPFVGGIDKLTVKASAIAMAGGPCRMATTVLPIAVRSCSIMDAGTGATLCNQHITMNLGAGGDIAFVDLSQPSDTVTQAEVTTQMQQARDAVAPPTGPTTETFASAGDADIATMNSIGPGAVTSFDTGGAGTPPLLCMGPSGNLITGVPPSGCPRRQMPVVNVGSNCTVSIPAHATPVGFVNVVVTGVTLVPITGPQQIRLYIDCTGYVERTSSPLDLGRAGCPNFGYPALTRPPFDNGRAITSLVK